MNDSPSTAIMLTELEQLLELFIQAWEARQTPPDLGEFLPLQSVQRIFFLRELIKVDLEYRWNLMNYPRRLTDYQREFAEISGVNLPIELVLEEIHVRKEAGFSTDWEEYQNAFPHLVKELIKLAESQEEIHSTALRSHLKTSANVKKTLASFKSGRVIDDFELLTELGQGAFAHVFLARQQSMQRLVALKISAAQGEEGQTLAQLDHPHIVRVFDQRLYQQGSLRLLYMEYLAGGTLADVIKFLQGRDRALLTGRDYLEAVGKSLENKGETLFLDTGLAREIIKKNWPELVCWIGSKLSQALDYAAQRKVLHRDIKPANVLLTREGIPKLADFNISYSSELPGAGADAFFGGSLAYMSPEQLEVFHPCLKKHAQDLRSASDQYALGILLWELLTGSRPYPDPNMHEGMLPAVLELIKSRKSGIEPKLIVKTERLASSALINVLTKMMSYEITQRYVEGPQLAEMFGFVNNRNLQLYLSQDTRNPAARLLSWACLIYLFLYFIPNMISGIFNYFYNVEEIVIPKLLPYRAKFEMIQLTINLIAYPLGILIGICLIRGVTKSIEEGVSKQSRIASQRLSLKLGHYLSMIALVEWLIAGAMYPISVRLASNNMASVDYIHFFLSLLMCGLLAVSYTFFGCTWFSLWAVYPRLVNKDYSFPQDIQILYQLGTTLWFYLNLAIAVPLISIAMMTLSTHTENSRVYLAMVAIGSLFGMSLILWAYSTMQKWLRVLQLAAKPPTSEN